MRHPLLNTNSEKHYRREGKSAIEELEKQATVNEQIGWCRGNIFKYKFRRGAKGEQRDDEQKIETFQNYLKCLENMKRLSNVGDIITTEAYQKLGKRFEYTL